VAVAQLCVLLARSVGGSQIPRLESATLNVSVLAFCAVAAFAWVITLGTIPLWYRRRVKTADLTQHLANRSTRPGLMLRTMIVAQVTAAVIVTTAAGLLVRSFVHLGAIDRGFDMSNLAAVSLMLPEAQYASPAAREAFYARLLPKLTALPGVVNATTVHLEPGTGQSGLSARMLFEGQQPEEGRGNPYGAWEPIMPTYFDTLGIPITQGRAFTDVDDSNAPPVAIVSESVAKRYWPDRTRSAGACSSRLNSHGPPSWAWRPTRATASSRATGSPCTFQRSSSSSSLPASSSCERRRSRRCSSPASARLSRPQHPQPQCTQWERWSS